MKRIHWNEAEQKQVAAAVYNLLSPRNFDEVPGIEQVRAFRKAQSILPEDRRREFKSTWNLSSSLPYIQAAFDKPFDKPTPKPDSPSKNAKTVSPVESKIPEESPLAPLTYQQLAMVEIISTRVVDQSMLKVTDKFVDMIVTKVIAALSVALANAAPKNTAELDTSTGVKHNPNPVEDVSKPKLIIGVIGLLNSQQNIVTAAFKDVAFKFYENYPKGKSPTVHYMLGTTGFMNHATDGKAIRTYKDRYMRITGGVTSVCDKVRKLYAQFQHDQEVSQ